MFTKWIKLASRIFFSVIYRLARRRFLVAQRSYETIIRSRIALLVRDRACCEISARRLHIQESSSIGFSQLSWASQTDYVFSQKYVKKQVLCRVCIYQMQNKPKVSLFIDVESLRVNSEQIHALINHLTEFDLLIGFNESKSFSLGELSRSLPKIGQRNYVMNLEEYMPRVYPLPLGLRDGKELQPSNYPMSESYYTWLKPTKHNKEIEVLAAFSTWTNPYRTELYKKYESVPIVKSIDLDLDSLAFKTSIGKIVPIDLYKFMNRSKYVVCPIGAGFDTHRFYEAILCGSIPLVESTRTEFDRIFEWFPCKVVDSLLNLSGEELQESYEFEQERVNKFLMVYPSLISTKEALDIISNG